jgi:uncharacterized protein
MENTIAFFEIPLKDFERGLGFYNFVFGLKLKVSQVNGTRRAFFPIAADGVGGALVEAKGCVPDNRGAIPYISYSEDINNILSKVTISGGEVIVPPKTTLFGAEHKFAMFIDSEGNRVGIFRTYLE